MIGGLPLGFAQPLVLLGLLSLPVLWWLLRLIPPRPPAILTPRGIFCAASLTMMRRACLYG